MREKSLDESTSKLRESVQIFDNRLLSGRSDLKVSDSECHQSIHPLYESDGRPSVHILGDDHQNRDQMRPGVLKSDQAPH